MVSEDTTIINIAVPKEFLKRLDKAAGTAYMSRSEYIRRSVAVQLDKPREAASNWFIVEALPDSISDEELLKIVKIVKRGHA